MTTAGSVVTAAAAVETHARPALRPDLAAMITAGSVVTTAAAVETHARSALRPDLAAMITAGSVVTAAGNWRGLGRNEFARQFQTP